MHLSQKSTNLHCSKIISRLQNTNSIEYQFNNMETRALSNVTALLFYIISLLFVAIFLSEFYQTTFPAERTQYELVLKQYYKLLKPEPDERFIFLFLSVLTIPSSVALFLISDSNFQIFKKRHPVAALSINAILAILVVAGLSRFDFGRSLFLNGPAPALSTLIRLLGCVVAAVVLLVALFRLPPALITTQHRLASALGWGIFLPAMILQITAWRLFNEASMRETSPWSTSMDAFIYSISQVIFGKTVLVNFPAQYGLSAELIGGFFRLFPFSILAFSLVFCVMQVISLAAVFHAFAKETRVWVLRPLFGLALVLVTFASVIMINGVDEYYLQYWPLRFFWPALSIFALQAYKSTPDLRHAAAMSVIAAVGTIWNIESGLPIAIGFAALLATKWAFNLGSREARSIALRRHLLRALLQHGILFVAFAAAMAVYISAKAEHPPHWGWLVEYQKLFYGLGVAMLPMPLTITTPWMSVLALYLLGLLMAASAWRRTPCTRGYDLIFFVALLGWGLFTYYQGRSHILNLINVCWPAILLATILTDRAIRFVRTRRLSRPHLILPAVAIAGLFYTALPFVQNLGLFWQDTLTVIDTWGQASSPLVSDELAFIREHTVPGQACVLLTRRQGLYYAAAGLGNPIDGPGYSEMLTIKDRDALMAQLNTRRFDCVFIGTGKDSEQYLDTDVSTPFRDYETVATNAKGTLHFLKPKKTIA
ncbi:hypothetical protein AZA_38957 [Nitrospirillum viridazoti Y2]|nr:hypothetical protein AZA_38957 [Nitrospirillum amazonense Y2]